jgi:hypothetical protein
MEHLDQIINTISLAMGVGWASGINLYATLLMPGVLGATGSMTLPPDLQILAHPLVIGAAGCMYLVEFVADKIPGVDTGWDSIHTFIRIPAGALLAAGAMGDVAPAISLGAAIVGGGLAAGTHATKAGSRVLINTSPEPLTNWLASLSEDLLVFAAIWASLNHPVIFLGLLVVSIALMVWLIPKIWQGIKKVFRFVARLFGSRPAAGDDGEDPAG